MVIRNSQMDAFRESTMDAFEKRAAARLRSRFPARLAETTEDQLRETIRLGVERAKEYEITAESDVLRYLEYMVEYRPDFDEHDETLWAKRILRDRDLTGTQKMDRLDDFTTFELRR